LELSNYIRKVLNEKLKSIESVELIVVSNLSENILVIVPPESDNNLISGEKISYLIYRIWKLLKSSKWGIMKQVYIKGENKGIIAIPFYNNEFVIVIIFKYPTNLSIIVSTINQTLKELESIIVG